MKRHHISLKSKLAAALACLLPRVERDYYREHNAPADEILKLFEFDHIVLFAHAGSDSWWNIDPKLKAQHREKSRRDTAIVAKVKRLSARQRNLMWLKERLPPEMTLEMEAPKKRKYKWPSRKIQTRAVLKGKR